MLFLLSAFFFKGKEIEEVQKGEEKGLNSGL